MFVKTDVLICGGGIVGLAIARELLKKSGLKKIAVLEKEHSIGVHASGRNSGVLHAGIYYASDSLKSQFCRKGNVLMKEYCREKGIPVFESGKVIVTKKEEENSILDDLHVRALKNGAKAKIIDEGELKTIEPYAKTCGIALSSPDTAIVNPLKVLENLEYDLVSSKKVRLFKGFEFKSVKNKGKVVTNNGEMQFDIFINAAGAYSDSVAHMFGVGLNYRILPFKGTYKKLRKEKSYLVKGNIYPVPDLRNPFLGVHFTKAVDGTVYIGPTAIPAFGRENYGIFRGIDSEALNILYRDVSLLLKNPGFRKVVLTEPKKYVPKFFFDEVKELVENLAIKDIERSSKVGIRPQLVDWEKKKLVTDFVILKADNSIHILNTISPGFTSAIAVAQYVVEKYI
ncbi:MAG: L-2-hydroxyglutarate oxidase [Thermodesulfovibrionia bacterium]|nr:L-2-hydroxyglutarate oxidase [Thermodesulfovibrionia bacterium]